jgi:hypothetical protein
MAGILSGIQARVVRELLGDPLYIDARQAALLPRPCRLIERNNGPEVIPACSSHACSTRTGHVSGFDP